MALQEKTMGLFDQGFSSKNGLSPAAIALLGLLAVKGFENRDKIGGMLGGLFGGGNGSTPGTTGSGSVPAGSNGGLGGALGGLLGGNAAGTGGLGGLLGGLLGEATDATGKGGAVSGGLGDLLNSFDKAGHGDVANSWVKDGPDKQPSATQIEQSVGPDVLDQLAQATGMSRDDLLQRLKQVLPQAVDALTPNSRVPTAEEAGQHLFNGQA
jgi:uncharacterized protein YidB (DUF937 family)